MKKLILHTTGWLCIVAGALGLVLPLIPGTVLLITGVMLLSQHYSWARKVLTRARRIFPSLRRVDQ